MIKITDTGLQYKAHKEEINNAIQKVLDSGQYINGPFVNAFEADFAEYHGVTPYCVVSCNSGTDALVLALKAFDIGPGDEVITTAASYLATFEAILMVGATPVFCDIVNKQTDVIDPALIKPLITGKTKAILPVHLHGYACDMDQIMKIANEHGILVIEDCAQATGLNVPTGTGTKKAGTIAHAGTFSFFPTKNLGAVGDGGAVIFQQSRHAEIARLIKGHGCKERNKQEIVGMNSRLDAIQAAILSAKLPHLDKWNNKRAELAINYSYMLQMINGWPVHFQLPLLPPAVPCVLHHYVLRFNDTEIRKQVQTSLQNRGIEALQYYPIPQHEHPSIKKLGIKSYCKQAEKQALNTLALPLYPELKPEEQKQVVVVIREALSKT